MECGTVENISHVIGNVFQGVQYAFLEVVYIVFLFGMKRYDVTIRPTSNGMGVIVVRRQIVGNADILEAATGARGIS